AVSATYPKAVIGDWYGEGEPNNPRMMFLSHRGAYGAFAIEFRNCSSGNALDHSESGTWFGAGGKYTIVTASVDGALVHYVDEYETISDDGRSSRYRLVASDSLQSSIGFVFTATRVSKDFVLPDCQLTS